MQSVRTGRGRWSSALPENSAPRIFWPFNTLAVFVTSSGSVRLTITLIITWYRIVKGFLHSVTPRFIMPATARVLLFIGVVALLGRVVYAFTDNGFDIDEPLVPSGQIIHGGPPRDGIPAIDTPRSSARKTPNFLHRVTGCCVFTTTAKPRPIPSPF
jgi:hypothetical protein